MEGSSSAAAVNGGAREPAKRKREEAADDEVEETGKRQREAGMKRRREAEEGSTGGDGVVPEERRTRMRVQPPPQQQLRAALQRLVNACGAVFRRGTETVPPPAAVSLIRGLLDGIGPDDVGLRTEVRFFHKMNTAGRQNPQIITCKNLYECDNFTIAVFFLPQGTVMPLHDHPGMTVFSKLLVGSAHVASYDWIEPSVVSGAGSNDPDDRLILAKKVLDHDLTTASGATSSWVLYPSAGGNMHRFVAGEDGPCAFLDVLSPPYSPVQRRGCTFYQDFPYELHPNVISVNLTEEQKRRLAWLRPIDTPKDLRIFTLPYRGPAIL